MRLVDAQQRDPTRGHRGPSARTRANARKAAKDASTVAYIGEFNSGASKISASRSSTAPASRRSAPSNTYNGLTTPVERGEPGKYYPTGVAHLLPDASRTTTCRPPRSSPRCATAAAQGLAFVHDDEVYGKGMNARPAVATAARLGLPVVANRRISRNAPSADPPRQGRLHGLHRHHRQRRRAVVPVQRAARHAAVRQRRRGRDGLRRAPAAFGRTAARSSPSRRCRRPDQFGNRDPYFVYGYEAMKLILDGLAASGGDPRGSPRLAADRPEPPERARHLRLRRQRRHHAAHLRALRRDPQGRARVRRDDHRRLSSSRPSSSSSTAHSPSGRGSSPSPRSRTATNTCTPPRVNATTSSARPRPARTRPRTPPAGARAAPAPSGSPAASAAGPRPARRGARPSRPAGGCRGPPATGTAARRPGRCRARPARSA